MIKKIEKEIQRLEKQKTIKNEKRLEIDEEINVINSNLKELYSLKNQYEKLQQNTNGVFHKITNTSENK